MAFHHVALYRFAGDTKKGQAKGQDVGGTWFAVLKSGIPATPSGAAGGADHPDDGAGQLHHPARDADHGAADAGQAQPDHDAAGHHATDVPTYDTAPYDTATDDPPGDAAADHHTDHVERGRLQLLTAAGSVNAVSPRRCRP